MEWTIIGRDMQALCRASTVAPKAISIFDDKHLDIITNNVWVSSYDFSINQQHANSKYFTEGNYIAFKDRHNRTRIFTLMSHDGNHQVRTWHAEEVGLGLINVTADKWDYSNEPHTIAWYLDNLVLKNTGWEIGVNEISSLTRSLKFEGQSGTQLTRLGDVANQFDGAEVAFEVEMTGSRIAKQTVNIYKKIGHGQVADRYIDNVDLLSLQTSGSIEDLRTSMIGYGSQPDVKDGENTEDVPPIDFADLSYDDGQFFSPKGDKAVYDRVNGQIWRTFRGYNYTDISTTDGYLGGVYTYDTKDPNELLTRTISRLKEVNTLSEIYEANLLHIDANIGEYVQIAHHGYNPPIYLQARVEQITYCYSAKGKDTAILGDYQKLESQIDPRIKEMIDQLADQIKPNYTWLRYAKDDKGTGMTSTPTTDTKYVAIVSNKSTGVPSDNPADYAGHWQLIKGNDGKDGIPGATGADGKTSYTHFAYANNVSGTADFSLDDPTGRSYMGVYSDFTKADSNNPSDYVWLYTKGETGPEGMQGAQGPKGDAGIPGKPGVDGKTPYTHVAYADNDKGGGFSQNPANKAYMGWYSDFTANDSTDTTKYAWSLIKGRDGLDGAQGIPGKPGADGKTSYTHIAYADTAIGGGFSQSPDGKKYIGMYVDFTANDSSDPQKYAWSLIKGADGKDGANGTPGKAGADGKTPYFHTAWANSSDGKTGFSITDSANKSYLGTYTDFTQADSTDTTKYAWSLIKGADGANGAPGKPGADGKTPYFHQAWADSKDGKINFSTTDPTNRGYLGTYSDFTQADSTDPSKYFWVELVGNLQVGVRNLLKGTADFSNGLNVSGANGTVITGEVYNGNKVLKGPQLTASNSYHDPYVSNTIDVAKGEYYALSFYAKTDAPSMVMRCYFFSPTNTISSINNQGFTSTSSDGLSTFTITNQWKQYWIVWRTNINTTVKRVIIGRREKSLAGSDTGSIFINSPMLVEGNKAVGWQAAPEDTQQQIDTINKGLSDTNSKIAAVTKVDSQPTAPTNPKKGDQWWVKDANGDINAFKIWDGTKWAPSTITQSLLVIKTLDAVNINGSVINGSKFTNNFDYTDLNGINFKGVTEIANGSYKTDFKIATTNQVGHVYVQPDGLHTYVTGRDGNKEQAKTTSLGFDALSLSNGNTYGTLTAEDVYRIGPESWSNSDAGGTYTIAFERRWGRVWVTGELLIPTSSFGNYHTVFTIKTPGLRPKKNRWFVGMRTGNVPVAGEIEMRPNGEFVAIGVPQGGRYTFEGVSYSLGDE